MQPYNNLLNRPLVESIKIPFNDEIANCIDSNPIFSLALTHLNDWTFEEIKATNSFNDLRKIRNVKFRILGLSNDCQALYKENRTNYLAKFCILLKYNIVSLDVRVAMFNLALNEFGPDQFADETL